MAQNETARTTVYLDGKQAESALGALADKAKVLKKDLKEALESGDNVKFNKLRAELGRVESAQRSVTKESFDVQNVLMNINKVSWRDLEKAQKAILSQLKNMVPATEEYIKKSEELRQVTNRIDGIRASTHATTGVMGRLTQSIGGMSGPVGDAINGMINMGKAMWALVANPIGLTIAAIVGSLTLLYKAFTSTDSGAVAMEGTMKAIGNIMDILIDRAMSYYKMLWSFVTLDFKGMKENAKAAFGNIVGAIKDTADAGWNYAKVMDDINDRESAAANRMTKLRVDIETLKNKAQKLSGKEKLAMLKEAMDKEIELNGIETGFLAERNAAETSNLASKIQNDKLSMAQKEEQLKKWLAIDDKGLAAAMENDAAFAEFENKNEGEFQKLQKTKADEIMKQAELQTGTLRLQNKLATEEKTELTAGVKASEDAKKKIFEQLEIDNRKELNIIKQQKLDKLKAAKSPEEKTKIEVDNNAQVLEQERKFLEAKMALQIKYGDDYSATKTELLDKQLKAQEELDKKSTEDKKKLFDKELKDLENKGKNELAQVKKDALAKGLSEEETKALLIAKEIEYLNHRLALQQKYGEDTVETTTAITAKINELAENALKGDEDRLKELDDLKKKYADDEVNAKKERDDALAALDAAQKAGLIKSEEEYQLLKNEINKKYEQTRLEKAIETGQKVSQVVSMGANLVQTLMDAELANAGDNEEKKAAIRKKYATAQFLMAASQIVVNTAVAIMQGFAQLGPIGGAIAAVILTATGVAQLAIANSERQKMIGANKGKQSGGYADSDSNDSTPVGVYHANEFIASGPAVRNPTIKPVLDIIDIAQRSGTIRSLNLPAMLGQNGRQSGGYASPASQSSGFPPSVISGRDSELISAIKELNYQLKAGIKASVNKFGHGGIDESISDINKFNGLTK